MKPITKILIGFFIKLEFYAFFILTPFAVYFVVICGRFEGVKLQALITGVFFAAPVVLLFVTILRILKLNPILTILYNKHDTKISSKDLRNVKKDLLNYPFFEGSISIIRWFIGIVCAEIFVFLKTGVLENTLILLTWILIIPITFVIFYFTTENSISKVLTDTRFSNISMPLKSIRPFSLFGRTLLLLISVILIPLVIFTYLFYLLYHGLIQLNNLYLHFAFIISLSFITILIAAYESTVNIRLGLKLTVKTLEKMRKHESDVNLPMISKDEIGIISQYINILAAALRNHTKKNNELTKNLEHKVQERTKKLHENTIELTSVNTSLKEAEEKSRLLLENSPDYIIYMDKEYNIQYFNRVPSGVFIENKGSLFDIIIPEYRENIITAINNVFTTGQKQLTESKILLQNDTPIWFENRFVAIKNDDLVNGAMIIATDITQKKESQARLEEMQKAAVKNAHIAGMANIAIDVLHNVGNVLNSIMTSGQIALDTLKNSQANRLIKANELLLENKDKMEDFILNDPKGKKLLDYYFLIGDKIIDGNTLLTNHLHRILEKAKVINDIIIAQQVIVPFKSITETLNISELLDEAIKLHENDLNQFHIHFNKKYENVPQVCVQRVKLTFIFMSLLKNAKEAMLEMPMGKRVIDLSIQKVNHSVQVKISDTGCGIGHEFLEKVFFYGFTTKQKGLGFALHSCANYMAEMGGKIRVQSSGVGKGAIFILSFPLQTVDI